MGMVEVGANAPTITDKGRSENDNSSKQVRILKNHRSQRLQRRLSNCSRSNREINEKGFDAEVGKWKESGGDQMRKEYEEAYKKANK